MPYDWIADWKPLPSAPKADQDWSALTRGLAKKLVALEPKVRFRIRQIPAVGKLGKEARTSEKGVSAKQDVIVAPVSLTEQDVPQELKARLEIPPAREWWVRTYQCFTCENPKTHKKPAWVPDIRQKLHKGHDLRPGNITHKGIENTWKVTHRLFSGSPQRIKGMSGLGYCVALTTLSDDPKDLAGYDAIMILPKNPKLDYEREKIKLAKVLKSCEQIIILPPDPTRAVQQILSVLHKLDPQFLDPPEDAEIPPEQEEAELANLRAKDRLALQFLRNAAKVKAANASKSPPTKRKSVK